MKKFPKVPHPGTHLLNDVLVPLELSVSEAAEILGVSRITLSNVINGKNGISPEMAIRLSIAFGGHPEVWLRMQMDYNLATAAERAHRLKVKQVWPPEGEPRATPYRLFAGAPARPR